MYKILLISSLAFLLLSCKTSKETILVAPYEEELLDTLTVSAPVYVEGEEEETYDLSNYNASASRSYDLIHTKLDIRFDWDKEHVIGKADLTLSPLLYPLSTITLDAKNFDLHKVRLSRGSQANLKYTYDGSQIAIMLDKNYVRGEEITLHIDYTAKPSEGAAGGSAAITSDRGLFFINADGSKKLKPKQIWTQGETEHNSKWFPTFDKPNERTTQEVYLTVKEGLQTLSNGKLVSSKSNGDGTKTDYWKQDMPHAPYLFMVAVGDFARVKDTWKGVPLEYMVDPPYEKDARKIFEHTPEMLTYFSELLDYPYPWDKYSQIIVEDFVSGAMENTTAVTFGDFVQKTSRELIDDGNDKIVAHEMFHHWFGDLVTCESWANLTLNEGFANYSEYLWYEYKYGKDAADEHRAEELNTYLYVANQSGTHPLIHYVYEDKEEMFDVHSYNKGGLVLHMLRNYIGDEAFYLALNKYLNDNKYTAVEVAELRMAFEDVTGMDLNWFFDQWYLDEGHPTIEASYNYSPESESVGLSLNQVQDVSEHRPVFILPLEVAIISQTGEVSYHKINVNARNYEVAIENIDTKPLAVLVDGKSYTLLELRQDYTEKESVAILKHSTSWQHKMDAVRRLDGADALSELANDLLEEDHHSLRLKGVAVGLGKDHHDRLSTIILTDPHSAVRAAALTQYASEYPTSASIIASAILEKNTEAYPVMKSALNVLYDIDRPNAIKYAEKLSSEKAATLVPVLSSLLAETGDRKYLNYIEDNFENISVYQVYNVFGAYGDLLVKQEIDVMYEKAMVLQTMGQNHPNMYYRHVAKNTMTAVRNKLEEIAMDQPSKDLTSKIAELTSAINSITK